jgi:hypothetical protein
VEPRTAERRRADDPRYPLPLRPWVSPAELVDLFVGVLVAAFIAYLALYAAMLSDAATCPEAGVAVERTTPAPG